MQTFPPLPPLPPSLPPSADCPHLTISRRAKRTKFTISSGFWKWILIDVSSKYKLDFKILWSTLDALKPHQPFYRRAYSYTTWKVMSQTIHYSSHHHQRTLMVAIWCWFRLLPGEWIWGCGPPVQCHRVQLVAIIRWSKEICNLGQSKGSLWANDFPQPGIPKYSGGI